MLKQLADFPHNFLVFFRLIDAHDGMVSITNVALMIVLYKLAVVQSTSITDIGALLVALSNYNLKKYINIAQKVQTVSETVINKSEDLSSQL